MMTFILSCFCFAAGTLFGMALAKVRFSMMPWKLLKWHPESLGYRIDPDPKPKIKRGERAYLALPLDTSELKPGEEIVVKRPE